MAFDMDEHFKEMKKAKQEINDLTNNISDLIKKSGLDKKNYGLDLNKVFALLFDEFDTDYDMNDNKVKTSFDGSLVKYTLEYYRGKRIKDNAIRVEALYEFLVENGYDKSKRYDIGFGDRYMYYIPTKDTKESHYKKKVIHFENQNVRFVVVIESGTLHIRKVYQRIEDKPDYGWYSMEDDAVCDLKGFRERIGKEGGLEFAIANLTSDYQSSQYADDYDEVKYPSRISLGNMIKNNFGKKSPAFAYGDNRDKNYVLSADTLLGSKAESLTKDAKYYWEEVVTGMDASKKIRKYIDVYVKKNKRNSILDELI
jgi:hypothetical protein